MKESVKKYIEYLKEQKPFLLNNYNFMVAFARSIINTCDDDTYFWLNKSTTEHLSDTNLTQKEVFSIIYNTLRELSHEIADEFLADIKKGKIKFFQAAEATSKFVAIRSKETRELEDYQFEILNTGDITEIFNLIHEYTHKLMDKINVPHNRNKDKVDIYDEAAAIFSELLLAKRLAEKYPPLREDIKTVIGKRINDEINGIIGIYETFNVVSKVKSGIPEERIKEECAQGTYTYESICNSIINKETNNVGIHFIGLLTAINVFYTSTDLPSDFMTIISEGKKGEYKFVASKVPNNPSETTKYIMEIRKLLSGESSKSSPPIIKKPQ